MCVSNLAAQLVRLPIFLALIAGLVVAVVTWRKHPQVSLLALVALVIFLALGLASSFLSISLPLLAQRYGSSGLIPLVKALNLIFQVLGQAGGWILILIAIFSRRAAPRTG